MALTKISGSILKDPLNLGEVSIGGTLTYEDVTNIDSVGIITARTGIKVLAGGINAVGVVTATSLTINDYIYHHGDTNTFIGFESNDTIRFNTNGSDKLKINSSGHLILADDNDTYIHHPAADSFAITTGGNERLRINSTGAVIIANKLTNSASYTSHNANFYGGNVNTGGVRIEVAHSTTSVSGNTASGSFPHHLLLSNYSGTGFIFYYQTILEMVPLIIECVQLDLIFQQHQHMQRLLSHIRQLVLELEIYNFIWKVVIQFQKNFASHLLEE